MKMNKSHKIKNFQKAENFYSTFELGRVLVRGPNFVVRVCVNCKGKGVQTVKMVDMTSGTTTRNDKEVLNTVLNEIELMKKCSGHPNIVKILNLFQTSSHILILMEPYPQTNLYEILASNGMLSLGQTRRVVHQLLEAVQFIHSKMIVHRNIKLENILSDDDLNLKLGSFELACAVESDVELKDFTGSLSYIAPELVGLVFNKSDEGHGRPIDVWAVGVIMATLLTGNYPFWDLNLPKMMQTIAMSHINFTKPAWNNVNDPCRDLLERLLDCEASRRITASQARSHPFLMREASNRSETQDKKRKLTFKVVAIAVHAVIRIRMLGQSQKHSRRINTLASVGSSYSVRYFRRFIDSTASKMYNHWIGEDDKQKRVLLFQNSQKQYHSRIKM